MNTDLASVTLQGSPALRIFKEPRIECGTTLTRLVVTHLEHLRTTDDSLAVARVTRRLAGSLRAGGLRDEYRDYLDRKYG